MKTPCLNLSLDKKSKPRCKIYTEIRCHGCKSVITDKYEYLKRLLDVWNYSKAENLRYEIQKEIKQFIMDYNIKVDPFSTSDDGKYEGWYQVYREDQRRGAGGGGSKADSNSRTSMKALMKDNRPQECKQTVEQKEAIKEALGEFESEHGKLPHLGRSIVSHSKTDSYTGEPIEPDKKGSDTK